MIAPSDDMLSLLGVFTSEIKEMEQPFSGHSLFKYMARERRHFFSKPQIRFTQRTALNDPFELSKRWEEVALKETRDGMIAYIDAELRSKLRDDAFLLKMVLDEAEKRGLLLRPQDRATTALKLKNPAFRQERERIIADLGQKLELIVNLTFGPAFADNVLAKIIDTIGIFSVSETGTNVQLWGLYATSGRGFVLELNPYHELFIAQKTKITSFRKVKYTDDIIQALMSNPYYLFLIKNKKWEFEDEWRIIKILSEFDERMNIGDDEIYLWNVRPGMIRSVIFGYNYDQATAVEDALNISKFDGQIEFRQAVTGEVPGQLELLPFSA